jgi:hypothetical protein
MESLPKRVVENMTNKITLTNKLEESSISRGFRSLIWPFYRVEDILVFFYTQK